MVVVYTCITGGYDRLIRQPADPDTRYVCFTDRPPADTAGWEVRPLLSPHTITSPRLINRFHKILCYDRFPGVSQSLYLDGNVALLAPPSALARRLSASGCSIAALPHAMRRTVADELRACQRKLGPGEPQRASDLYQMQREQGFPDDLGLSANYLLLRDTGNAALRRAMERWWRCVCDYVERDQLSLQYCLWAEGVDLHFLPDRRAAAPLAKRLKHGAAGLSLLQRLRQLRVGGKE